MVFVHSLAKMDANGTLGWWTPAELGEAAPHYISFVIPVDEKRRFFPKYACETIVIDKGERRSEPNELHQQGNDSFLLRLGEFDVWFNVKPVPKSEARLPYVGRLQHPDFAFPLTEIEPGDHRLLDQIFETTNTFVIGCEPFLHYAGIEKLATSHLAER